MAVTTWEEDIDFEVWGSMPPNYGASATPEAGATGVGGTWNIPAYDTGDHISGSALEGEGREGQPPIAETILPLATGALEAAGLEGAFTPSTVTHRIPHNLIELQAQAANITASPGTTWTTASFVTLGDGTIAHWDGAAYAVGAAPV